MNKVILTGRFTKDPESRMGANSLEVSRFSLACSSDFVSKSGERETEFINCVAFGKTAQTINKFCKKGQQVCVTGRIRNSSYDAQDGTKRYTTDIVIDQLEFLGSKQGNGDNTSNTDASFDNTSVSNDIETTDISEDPYKDFGEEFTLSNDDLPF